MSLADTDISSGPYTTDGLATAFVVTFPFHVNAEVIVYKTTSADLTFVKLVLDSDYTLTGAGTAAGGTVTISPALASGFTIYIVRGMPLTQLTELGTNSTFHASVVETVWDRLMMTCQMLQELIDRAYLVAPGQASPALDTLATKAQVEAVALDHISAILIGQAQPAVIFGKFVAQTTGWVEAVFLEAYAGPPVGQSIIAKIKVDSVEQATNFTLVSGATYQRTAAATATTIPVTAGNSVEIYLSQIGTTYEGTDIKATIEYRKQVV